MVNQRSTSADHVQIRQRTLLDDVEILRRRLPSGIIPSRSIHEGTFGYVYGEPGLGKTFMMIDLAFKIALSADGRGGFDWLGAPVEQGGAVIGVMAEGQGFLGLRTRGWKQHHGLPLTYRAGFHQRHTCLNLLDEFAVKTFVEEITPLDPALLFIDSLSSNMPGGDDSKTSDMGMVIDNCNRIREALPRMALLLLHHPGWDRSRERGSSVLRDAADLVMSVTKKNGITRLGCTKDRNGPGFTHVPIRLVPLTLDDEGMPGDGHTTSVIEAAEPCATAQPDLTAPRRVALDTLKKIVGTSAPPTFGIWFRALPEKTVSDRRFYDVIDKLIKLGLVKKDGRRYVPRS